MERRHIETQAELAEAIGADKSVISRWLDESNPATPGKEWQVKLGAFFGDEEDPVDVFRHPDDDWFSKMVRNNPRKGQDCHPPPRGRRHHPGWRGACLKAGPQGVTMKWLALLIAIAEPIAVHASPLEDMLKRYDNCVLTVSSAFQAIDTKPQSDPFSLVRLRNKQFAPWRPPTPIRMSTPGWLLGSFTSKALFLKIQHISCPFPAYPGRRVLAPFRLVQEKS
ncbi:helix-turn-helix transcriptional regulator [Bradyrhizobium sp. 2]|uniref:helix-turn-helix domain-containing protein n=1 Tax=Bradyrhizobium sp. 2 TaxID=190045 RepID=UPI001FF9C922|nr:helix-turn-helix transcriptional regulator [Bradyrhizobium sp. 2]MCK1459136.1 helix-turn-helix transcriptional regulator [Bradyrhizobium sp. 2]